MRMMQVYEHTENGRTSVMAPARAKYRNNSGAHFINNAKICQTNPGVSDEYPQFEIFYGDDKILSMNADDNLCIYGPSGLIGIIDHIYISKQAMTKMRNMMHMCSLESGMHNV